MTGLKLGNHLVVHLDLHLFLHLVVHLVVLQGSKCCGRRFTVEEDTHFALSDLCHDLCNLGIKQDIGCPVLCALTQYVVLNDATERVVGQ